MYSRNEWYVCGDVAGVDMRKRTVVMSIKGKIFRPEVFKVHGTINCVMSRELYESVNIYREVEVTGKMIFGENNYLLVESVKNRMEVMYESVKEGKHLQKKLAQRTREHFMALTLYNSIRRNYYSCFMLEVTMFDTTKHLNEKDLLTNAKIAAALIAVINEVQEIAKEVQKMRVDVDKLIENNK